MHADLVERVQVRADDGTAATLVVFDDTDSSNTTRRHMLENGEPCTPIDVDTWRGDNTGRVYRRIAE